MKFLHTADWQIGMRAAHVGAVGSRVRQERLEAGRRVMQCARDHGTEFVLVAGDTFEDNAVDRVLIQKVADILADFPGPVYLIPGNHDHVVPGSVWNHPAWSSRPNLHVLTENAPVAIPGGTLYPCPLFEKHASADPTTWIDARQSEGITIGLAHGTVEGVSREVPDFPIARDAAARAGLDYLALGHWHSTATFADDRGHPRMAYAGAHETTKFGERDSGNALLVEIDQRGGEPRLTTLRTGGLRWESREEAIRGPGELARLCREIDALEHSQETLLDLRLHGILEPEERQELGRIEELVAARFLFGRIDASGLLPRAEDDRWLASLPEGPLREAAGRLQRLSDPASTEPRPDYASAEVASRALIEFYSLYSQTAQ